MDATSVLSKDSKARGNLAVSTDASDALCYSDRMRLLVSIGASLVCGTAVAAVLFRYIADNAALPHFWDSDALAIVWTAFGGAGGILVLSYGLFSFILVTSYAYLDLATARSRLARAATQDDGTAPDRLWRTAFADTDFRSIAGQLTPYELGAAPLALLRILRTEIWRVYAKRLLSAATVAIVLSGMVIALAPWHAPVPAAPAAGQWQAFGAVLLLVGAATTWLTMDHAISRLAMTMTRLSTAWGEAPASSFSAQDRSAIIDAAPRTGLVDDLIVAVDRLVAALAAKPAAVAKGGTGTAAAIEGLKQSLRDAADEQRQAIERLGDQLARQHEDLAHRLEAARSAEVDAAALSGAMSQLAAAVDKLADPVLRRIQLLGATDRRLLAVLRRQEDMVGSVTGRWGDLVGALRAMSAGLGNFAETAERHGAEDARLVTAAGPAELGDELQELLDEISGTASPMPTAER
jgi:hypothetical protein